MTDDQLVQLAGLESAPAPAFVDAVIETALQRLAEPLPLEQRVAALEKVVADLLTRKACRCSK